MSTFEYLNIVKHKIPRCSSSTSACTDCLRAKFKDTFNGKELQSIYEGQHGKSEVKAKLSFLSYPAPYLTWNMPALTYPYHQTVPLPDFLLQIPLILLAALTGYLGLD